MDVPQHARLVAVVVGVAAEGRASVNHEHPLACLRCHAFGKDRTGKPCVNHEPIVMSPHGVTLTGRSLK
jgi:hypothetical protein